MVDALKVHDTLTILVEPDRQYSTCRFIVLTAVLELGLPGDPTSCHGSGAAIAFAL